jgi:hypothetical protein
MTRYDIIGARAKKKTVYSWFGINKSYFVTFQINVCKFRLIFIEKGIETMISTSELNQYLEIIFDNEEIEIIEKIIIFYLDGGKKRKTIKLILQQITPLRPKRPLYYVNREFSFISSRSRWIVENMGSYLDLLVKELRLEVDGKYSSLPLGKNIESLIKSNIDSDLKKILEKIRLYNSLFYVPSKHKYGPPNTDKHYFDVPSTIIAVLSAVKLGEELKKHSIYVHELAQDLYLPGHHPYLGREHTSDGLGKMFEFKTELIDLSSLLK